MYLVNMMNVALSVKKKLILVVSIDHFHTESLWRGWNYGKSSAGFSQSMQKIQRARLCLKSSSNANESFNRTLAAKAPKSLHFSKSESLNYRIASAVCQWGKVMSIL